MSKNRDAIFCLFKARKKNGSDVREKKKNTKPRSGNDKVERTISGF